jgi:hypothetical protein
MRSPGVRILLQALMAVLDEHDNQRRVSGQVYTDENQLIDAIHVAQLGIADAESTEPRQRSKFNVGRRRILP